MKSMSNNPKKKKVTTLKSESIDTQNKSSSQQNYEVESILNKKIENGEQLYRVKWKGYDVSESTWQPKRNLDNCSTLIVQFELKKLSQQKWEELQKQLQESQEVDHRQEFSERVPSSIYDHNLECVLQKNSVQIFKDRLKRVQILIKNGVDQPKDGTEIDHIIGPVINDQIQNEVPNQFRICLKSGQCCIMGKKKLYGEGFRSVLLNYYESLIEFSD